MIEIKLPQPFEENFDDVCKELMQICRALEKLLPDPTLSPEERLERLGRVAPQSYLKSANMKTARAKLNDLRIRLSELVPSSTMSPMEKLEFLVQRTHDLVPGETSKFYLKLEKLGDKRPSDNGR